MDEKEMIANCLRGDEAGLEALVGMFRNQAIAVAINILGNREDAEDACQDAFVQALRSLRFFDQQRNFRTWFLTIVSRRCLDQARKRKRFWRFFSRYKKEVLLASPGKGSPGPAEGFLSEKILRGLSPRERAALTLWANEGYTAGEISVILGCRPSTARVYLFNGRKKTKALLEK